MTKALRQGRIPPVHRPGQPRAAPYDALVRQADAWRRAGDHARALQAFHAIAQQHPERSDAHSNLAGILQACGHPLPALQAITRALELDPRSVAALRNSAEILKDFGEWDTVLATYDAALDIAPQSAELQFARGLQRLMLGQWADGWREHEARLRLRDLPLSSARLSSPVWDGTPLHGRHILLDAEQGLGDQIMCLRFIGEVAARGGRVTVRCGAALVALAAALPGVDTVIAEGDPIPAHDVHASLMSLPHLLGIDHPQRLSGRAYLQPVGACPDAVRQAMPHRAPRIGVVWAGSRTHRNDARRSIAPELLLPLVQRSGAAFVSLQRHDATYTALPEVFTSCVTDMGQALHTLNDTAHALRQLDALVTVDTAVAHLAGALGVRTVLLVPFVPDWRWMLGRTDTPWYDSMHLVRQQALFDWPAAIDAAVTALRSSFPTLQ